MTVLTDRIIPQYCGLSNRYYKIIHLRKQAFLKYTILQNKNTLCINIENNFDYKFQIKRIFYYTFIKKKHM